jgi:hypothetical protein
MTQISVSKFRKFMVLAIFIVAAGAVSLATPQTAYSAGFADSVAGKTTIKLKDIPGVGDTLKKLKLSKLANIGYGERDGDGRYDFRLHQLFRHALEFPGL